jgi:hypothetical protein
MSIHKARPGTPVDPAEPASTVMFNGRVAAPHAEIDGKPILGGLQNAVVEGAGRTPEEEKAHVKAYEDDRKHVKEVHEKTFDKKTGEPKDAGFKVDPVADAAHTGPLVTPPEEVKKVAEAEKKVEHKAADAKPEDRAKVADEVKKAEEKKIADDKK